MWGRERSVNAATFFGDAEILAIQWLTWEITIKRKNT